MQQHEPFFVEHNVEGVQGLHVAYNLLSERVERLLFDRAHAARNAPPLAQLSLDTLRGEIFMVSGPELA